MSADIGSLSVKSLPAEGPAQAGAGGRVIRGKLRGLGSNSQTQSF
jgi:hypothetical protein